MTKVLFANVLRAGVPAVVAIALSSSRSAYAQPIGGSLGLGAAHALANDQAKELGFGGAAFGALSFRVVPGVAFDIEGTALALGRGSAPKTQSLAPRDGASLFGLGVGGHVRPFIASHRDKRYDAAGFWLGAHGGIADTGGLTRAAFNVQLGYDAWFRRMGVGPFVGVVYVPQPKNTVRPDDAIVGVLGVRAILDPAVPTKPVFHDRDHDGIPDELDKCPDAPEDFDGFQDEDGCPDLDNDRDGIPDARDKCPNEPEDFDGFQDEDGCPDPDNDRDGIPDVLDKCPNEPEDFDGYEDADGCPEPDNDKDGIPDVSDKCPNEPETYNGYADEDGCPDENQVRVVGNEIVLDEKIYFPFNRTNILPRSFPLIKRLAKLLTDHPEYVHVTIEGHADEQGSDEYNQKLSEGRAAAVRTRLIGSGIASGRLTVVGYGESRPQVQGTDEAAHQQNRRVEFRIKRASDDASAGGVKAGSDGEHGASAPAVDKKPTPQNAAPAGGKK